MQNKEYVRKMKEDRPVVAICYDFDKTLSPDDMQAQGFIQSVGYSIAEFWRESNGLAENNDMDQNLAYMFKMMEAAEKGECCLPGILCLSVEQRCSSSRA